MLSMFKHSGSWLLVMLITLAFAAVPGCSKDGKKETPKTEKKNAEKKQPDKKPEAKKSEEKKEPDKKPEAKKSEEKKPTPAEALDALVKTAPANMDDSAQVLGYLQGLNKFAAENAKTPEAAKAKILGAKLKFEGVMACRTGQVKGLMPKLMVADGVMKAEGKPSMEQMVGYGEKLAKDFGELAESAPEADKARLEGMAKLMSFIAADQKEALGQTPGVKVEIPEAWKAVEKPTEEGDEAEKEEKKVDAESGEATEEKTEDGEKKAEAPAMEMPKLTDGGVNYELLKKLAADGSPVANEARLVWLLKVKEGLSKAQSPLYKKRWLETAQGLGKLVCTACPVLDTIPMKYVGKVLFMAGNRGLVCETADALIKEGKKCSVAVQEKCLDAYQIKPENKALLTPMNAVVYRVNQVIAEALALNFEGDSIVARAGESVKKELRMLAGELLAIYPPMKGIPKEKWKEMKDRFVMRGDLIRESPAFSFQPVEIALTDELGVSVAMRPLLKTGTTPWTYAEATLGYAYPGKVVATVEQIEKELKEKNKKLKDAKVEYNDRFDAYIEKVTIKGTKFDKPDYSIPSVVEAAKALSAKANEMEPKTFGYLKGQEVLNNERPTWENFADTVGKALLVGVDQATPALLWKRVLDSFYHADYKDDRLVKGTGCLATVPTVYYTEKFVDDAVLDTTHRRPVLVYVTDEGTIRFYPPKKRSRYSKMEAKRRPKLRNTRWPRKYRSIDDHRNPDDLWNLFMAYTSVSRKNWEEEVAGIAAAMQKKWDNGNVFYLMAEDKASSGLVVKVADILSRLPGEPIAELGKAFPGYTCDPENAPELCINNIVVLFPEVEIPYLPGKKKVNEVAQTVYCDKKDIASRIGNKRGAIKFCYDPELQKNPSLKGRVLYKFTIGANGRIKSIRVASDNLGNRKVVNCAMNVIKRIRFKRPIGGECVIQYPYLFKP